MTTYLRIFALSAIIALVLSACNLFNNTPNVTGDTPTQAVPQPTPIPAMTMNVTYQIVDQTIEFTYLIGNASGLPIPGPVTVTDDRVAGIICSDLALVGNFDPNLDANEALSCNGTYTITQLDLDAGSVAATATASAGGSASSAVTTVVPIEQARKLTLTKTPDPLTFNAVGESIIYSYVITNSGTVSLGPVQFTIIDDKIGTAFNCGSGGTILAPGGTVSCSATYLTTDADLTAGTITNSAYASDGTTNSDPVTAAINKSGTTTPPSNLTPGSDISHTVIRGEWLWQIARCYGAAPRQVIAANPQIPVPAEISPGIIVTVPDIGSDGTIYGPPCVVWHTVQSGETWNSIANDFNADPFILQDANPGGLIPGSEIKVPRNSAGG